MTQCNTHANTVTEATARARFQVIDGNNPIGSQEKSRCAGSTKNNVTLFLSVRSMQRLAISVGCKGWQLAVVKLPIHADYHSVGSQDTRNAPENSVQMET
jgi:hypothetical protein